MTTTIRSDALCTATDLDDRFGTATVTRWSDVNDRGVRDSSAINRAINRATGEILTRLGNLVSVFDNDLKASWAIAFAGFYLSKNGVEPPPASLQEEVDELRQIMTKEGLQTFGVASQGPWEITS